MSDAFSLSPAIDLTAAKAAFAANGRLEIADFLGPGQAELLRSQLVARSDWTLVLNAGAKVYEMSRQAFAALDADRVRELDDRVVAAARAGFQYRYEAIRVPDAEFERQKSDLLLDKFVSFMSSRAVLDLLGDICGADDWSFADGQATAYSPGHFLTRHNDDVTGKHRRAAYVFGLSPGWRAEWGGLLLFHGPDGNIEHGFAPAMGALRLFTVPCEHSVSYVTPFAPEPRLAITGWLRATDET